MNKLKEIVRLLELKHSQRQIAHVLGISRSSVQNYSMIIKRTKITYKQIQDLNDEEMETAFEISKEYRANDPRYQTLLALFPYFAKELNRTGVTLHLLWEEYRKSETSGYSYSQFCFHYDQWKQIKKVSMHLEHKYGDKMFVDFTGDKLKIINPISGLETEVEVFVSVLGGSGLTYAQAIPSQRKEDFIRATENSLHYFGGVPNAIVPDCLKSAVTKGNKYEPEINPDFANFALHYNTVILPARPYHPKDKSPVEIGVKLIYQRVFAPIRNMLFTSIEELNEAIRLQLEIHNSKLMSKVNLSRRELFNRYEKDVLKPLPIGKYEFKKFSTATVQINYHVYLKEDKHYYSVPYRFRGNKINIIYTDRVVEIFYRNERIAIHERVRIIGRYSTKKEHMPSHHKFYAEWNPERILSWSEDIGDKVKIVSSHIMATSNHPEQGFKSCIGIIGLAKKFGASRVNRACEMAISYKEYTYKFVNNILNKGMDKLADEQELPFEYPEHENIRGNEYYKIKEN